MCARGRRLLICYRVGTVIRSGRSDSRTDSRRDDRYLHFELEPCVEKIQYYVLSNRIHITPTTQVRRRDKESTDRVLARKHRKCQNSR